MATTWHELQGSTSRHAARWIPPMARFGCMARGAVYLIVGLLAIQAAAGQGRVRDAKGAIAAIAGSTQGTLLLWLLTAGLVGFALWRLCEALFDAERLGRGRKALGRRAAFFGGALVALAMAFSAGAMALGHSQAASSTGQERAWTARLLSLPFGPWLVGAVGVAIIAVGMAQLVNAYKKKFMEFFPRLNPHDRRTVVRLGRLGVSSRGVVFLLTGGFFLQAAAQSDASEAGGMDVALAVLARQPYGVYLLALVAAGLMAFGVFCFAEARYRHFSV